MKTIEKIKGIIESCKLYIFDVKNDIKYSTLSRDVKEDQEMLLSSLVVAAHTIEKGLTMPHKRYPFGEVKAMVILQGLKSYVDCGYDLSESRFFDIVGIMKEYRKVNVERVGKSFCDR